MHHRFLFYFFVVLFLIVNSFAAAKSSAGVADSISLSEFAHFLKHTERSDLHHLYDWKMGAGSLKMEAGRWQILRSGTVGNYQYVVVKNGATENGEAAETPILFVDANAQKCYASWKQADIMRGDPFSESNINTTTAAAVDEELKISDLGLLFEDFANENAGQNSGYSFFSSTKFLIGLGAVAALFAGGCGYYCLRGCCRGESKQIDPKVVKAKQKYPYATDNVITRIAACPDDPSKIAPRRSPFSPIRDTLLMIKGPEFQDENIHETVNLINVTQIRCSKTKQVFFKDDEEAINQANKQLLAKRQCFFENEVNFSVTPVTQKLLKEINGNSEHPFQVTNDGWWILQALQGDSPITFEKVRLHVRGY